MKRLILVFLLSVAFLVIFGLIIYPTPYKYTEYILDNGIKFPVKINRFTGETLIYSGMTGEWLQKLQK